jgi:phosphopantothenoylcysteine decarboxylase/phosphopantothenate--cysteine ligase
MRCLVTAGPTYEPLDEVRRLTNFSTGRLGSALAAALTRRGHEVHLLLGHYATCLPEAGTPAPVRFTTTADLRERLQELSGPGIGAVFHAAAVSDFGFGRVYARDAAGQLTEVRAGKIATRGGALLAELVPTPKILAELRGWYPQALLAGWKYEVDGGREEALAKGRRQLQDCATDRCVVNGRAYGEGFGVLDRAGAHRHCHDLPTLMVALADWVTAGGEG